MHVRTEVSESNLKNHANTCTPTANAQTGAIEVLMQDSQYTKAKLCTKLMLWVICCHRPYTIVEDRPLLEIFRMLNSKAKIPSARTVSCDIQEKFLLTKKNVAAMLQVHQFIPVSVPDR